MRKFGVVLIILGVLAFNLNMFGVVFRSEFTGPACFPCVVEPAPSLDGVIVNQFFKLGIVTAASVVLIIIGYRMRKKHA